MNVEFWKEFETGLDFGVERVFESGFEEFVFDFGFKVHEMSIGLRFRAELESKFWIKSEFLIESTEFAVTLKIELELKSEFAFAFVTFGNIGKEEESPVIEFDALWDFVEFDELEVKFEESELIFWDDFEIKYWFCSDLDFGFWFEFEIETEFAEIDSKLELGFMLEFEFDLGSEILIKLEELELELDIDFVFDSGLHEFMADFEAEFELAVEFEFDLELELEIEIWFGDDFKIESGTESSSDLDLQLELGFRVWQWFNFK